MPAKAGTQCLCHGKETSLGPGFRRDDEGGSALQRALMQPILYCHHESGHSYKIALALTLIGIVFIFTILSRVVATILGRKHHHQ